MNELWRYDQLLKMFGKIAFAFIYVYFSSFVLGDDSSSQASPSLCDLINSGPVPYKTSSPINVNSTNVTFVAGPPLIIQNAFFSKLHFENIGDNFEVFPVDPDHGYTYGGVLCDQFFKFYKLDFYINPDLGTSFHTIDGIGTPLTCRIEFINSKYDSFEESLKHRNGLVIIDVLIDFAPEDNPLFYPVEFITVLLRKAGTQITLPAILLNLWLNQLRQIDEYFAFFGSFVDRKTGQEFQCAINILPKKIIRSLSQQQFQRSFGSLQNKKGGRQNSAEDLKPTNGREIYEGQDIAQRLTLF